MNIRKATLIKKITDDGLVEVHDHVPIGKKYDVDIDSITIGSGYNIEKKIPWQRLIVYTPDNEWLPIELLNLETERS